MNIGEGIDPDNLPDTGPRREDACDRAGSAPDLEHPRARPQRNVLEVGLEHRVLLRVGRAQFEHIGDPALHGLVGVGDRGVEVCHETLLCRAV